MKFYPMKSGGGTTSFGVVFMVKLEVLAILEGGATSFHSLKGGGGGGCEQFYPVLSG